ncbi:hypothetical protein C8R46DRAFT_1226608 [Mycena filopes]|nr:hypothetical protein C8R46DRAFT_1226608 [Mycena filopes]
MILTIRHASNTDHVLQYGTVAATLLKDIGTASNQPYLQAVASISLLIMETDRMHCMKLTKRTVDLVTTIINICHDCGAELAPAMMRSITQLSETLEKILTFVRGQVKRGFWRKVFRSMEDADSDLIVECNAGLKHALDVFGVQSSIIAVMTIGALQRQARELVAMIARVRNAREHQQHRVAAPALSNGATAQASLHGVNASSSSLARSNLVILSSSPLPQVSTGGHAAQEVEHHFAALPALSDDATIGNVCSDALVHSQYLKQSCAGNRTLYDNKIFERVCMSPLKEDLLDDYFQILLPVRRMRL